MAYAILCYLDYLGTESEDTVCLPVLLYQIQRVLLGGSVGPLVPSS